MPAPVAVENLEFMIRAQSSRHSINVVISKITQGPQKGLHLVDVETFDVDFTVPETNLKKRAQMFFAGDDDIFEEVKIKGLLKSIAKAIGHHQNRTGHGVTLMEVEDHNQGLAVEMSMTAAETIHIDLRGKTPKEKLIAAVESGLFVIWKDEDRTIPFTAQELRDLGDDIPDLMA